MLLEGKTGLVMGVANKRSIAWAIARSAHSAGARLILTYQSERLGDNVRKLAPDLGDPLLLPCDVANDEEIDRMATRIDDEAGGLDFVVHALAYAPREELGGSFMTTSREGFRIALDVSAYSLIAVARRAAPLMKGRDGSIITLTYLGSDRGRGRLQRHGSGQGRSRSVGGVTWRTTWDPTVSGSTPSRPGRSARWPLRPCPASRAWSGSTPNVPR